MPKVPPPCPHGLGISSAPAVIDLTPLTPTPRSISSPCTANNCFDEVASHAFPRERGLVDAVAHVSHFAECPLAAATTSERESAPISVVAYSAELSLAATAIG
jgi:hypothetical protein